MANKRNEASTIELVIEGDSWEHLPNLGLKELPIVGGTNYDLSRALAGKGFVIHNLAYWGDTLSDIVAAKDYVRALRNSNAKALLLGGGGNDLLGNGRLAVYLELFDKDLAPEDYLKPQFAIDLEKLRLEYESALHDIAADEAIADTEVFVHGYDYARPMELGWIGKPMERQGIDPLRDDLRRAIVRVMIDRFNAMLKALETKWDNLHYVDFRTMVGDRWHDELHPRQDAFEDLADYMAKKIRRALRGKP